MATSLILLLYFANMSASLSVIFSLLVLASVIISIIQLICITSCWPEGANGELSWSRFKIPLVIISISTSFLVFLPAKTTMYQMAAVYVAGQATDTQEFKLVRQMITNELQKIVDNQTKEKSKEK